LSQVVLIVGRDSLIAADFVEMGERLTDDRVLSYGKLIDMTQSESELTPDALDPTRRDWLVKTADKKCGPVAIIGGPAWHALLPLFSGLAGKGQEARLFANIHEARSWINRHSLASRWRPTNRK
jgi:hypothetical protein